MLTVIENKRRTIAAAATAVLLLLVGFVAGRVNQSTPAGVAPQIAALTAQTVQLKATARSQTAALQAAARHDSQLQAAHRTAQQLHATNTRLATQLATIRDCTNSHHPRTCLRLALR